MVSDSITSSSIPSSVPNSNNNSRDLGKKKRVGFQFLFSFLFNFFYGGFLFRGLEFCVCRAPLLLKFYLFNFFLWFEFSGQDCQIEAVQA